MAYIDSGLTGVGQELAVDLGSKHVQAKVVELPFYRRKNS
jgi:glycine cleavage system aminomethyltransferase T